MIPASLWSLRDDGPKVIPHHAARPRAKSDARYQYGNGPLRRSVTAALLDRHEHPGGLSIVQGGVKRPWRRAADPAKES